MQLKVSILLLVTVFGVKEAIGKFSNVPNAEKCIKIIRWPYTLSFFHTFECTLNLEDIPFQD